MERETLPPRALKVPAGGERDNVIPDKAPGKRLHLTIQAGLVLTIVITGLIGATMSLLATRVYRDLNLEFQREYLAEIVQHEVADQLHELGVEMSELGISIGQSGALDTALSGAGVGAVSGTLQGQFRQGAITTNRIDLVNFTLLDPDMRVLGSASRNLPGDVPGAAMCNTFLDRAAQRRGAQRLQLIQGFCHYRTRPYYATLVPLGGLDPTAFLLLVADPVPQLSDVSAALGAPMRISLPDGTVVHSSPDWYASIADSTIMATYVLQDRHGDDLLNLDIARPLGSLSRRLAATENRVVLINLVVTFLTVLVALLFLKRYVLDPMKQLRTQLSTGNIPTTDPLKTSALREGRLVSFKALGDLYETLQNLAITDPLTGLYNRALFEDRLKQQIAESERNNWSIAVFMMDMNRFKDVNDSLGHHVGDELLRQVAKRLHNVLRSSDTLARFGGDEFAVILPGAGEAFVRVVAEKIRRALDPNFHIHGHAISASLSVGASLYPAHGRDVTSLLQLADIALYQAKRSGGHFALYRPPASGGRSAPGHTIIQALRETIEDGGLSLRYQPLLDTARGEVSYFEALVRWDHPELKRFSVQSLVSMAERNDLIRPLTDRVLDLACRDLAQRLARSPTARTGINVSMHDMQDTTLPERIEHALRSCDIPPTSLVIEITESGVMQDIDLVRKTLGRLTETGITLAIDDFGTGQASLTHLQILPVHALKIDKSFIMDLERDQDAEKIVRATIDLGHDMGIRVIAEGVHNEALYHHLHGLGCDALQGYYIGRPMRLEDIESWQEAADIRFGVNTNLELML